MRRRALRADRRGGRIGSSLQDFRDAVASRGADAMAEALIARHNKRMLNLAGAADSLSPEVLAPLTPLFPMDVIAGQLGMPPSRHPSDYGDSWLAHLGWGMDSAAVAARYLLCGQIVGASIVCRSQLERWTANVAADEGMPRLENESTVEWMDKVMASAAATERIIGAGPIGSESELLSDEHAGEHEKGVGGDFAAMSELLHGRGDLLGLVHWEARHLLDPSAKPAETSLEILLRPIRLSLRRVRVGLSTAAEDRSLTQFAGLLRSVIDSKYDALGLRNSQAMLFPLEPMALSDEGVERAMEGLVARYSRALRTPIDDNRPADTPPEILPALAFAERRYRALLWARRALTFEKRMLGDSFDADGLAATMTEMVFAAECAGVLAGWIQEERSDREVSDAFVVASSAMRSTVWMWLEDDDRAMGCARTVLEMIARLRVWRTKRQRAQRLEAENRTTPRDWVEAAGWRRLLILNRALGELAHGAPARDVARARETLVLLQLGAETEIATRIGRTHAVVLLTHLLQVECGRWTEELDATLGTCYWEITRLDPSNLESGIEPLLRHAWTFNTAKRTST
jgi:hypothetical protein